LENIHLLFLYEFLFYIFYFLEISQFLYRICIMQRKRKICRNERMCKAQEWQDWHWGA